MEGTCDLSPSGKVQYGHETLIGNWIEESAVNEIEKNEFIRKKQCSQLKIQKSQIMADLLLKPVKLSFNPENALYYGDTVQILSAGGGGECSRIPFKNYCNLNDLALSATVPTESIDHHQHLGTDSLISASCEIFPVARNSFILEHPENPSIKNVQINYGDVFRIRAGCTQARSELYLHSSPGIKFISSTFFAGSGNPIVQLSDSKNAYTLWRCLPLNSDDLILMKLGLPVPKKHRIQLQHALSGKNLCLERDHQIYNYFGCDQEVTVETQFDQFKRISWTNHWYFDTDRSEERVKYEEENKLKIEQFEQEKCECKNEMSEKADTSSKSKSGSTDLRSNCSGSVNGRGEGDGYGTQQWNENYYNANANMQRPIEGNSGEGDRCRGLNQSLQNLSIDGDNAINCYEEWADDKSDNNSSVLTMEPNGHYYCSRDFRPRIPSLDDIPNRRISAQLGQRRPNQF